MKSLQHLIDSNRAWAGGVKRDDPEFFARLARQQTPQYLWIGCSDSRVPATEICGLMPGEMFVHRNVANVVVHTDLNCLTAMQFAVDVLNVQHIIVCGHYGCTGVRATLSRQKIGLADNWLRHVQDVRERHRTVLAAIDDGVAREGRLCELNVIDQVAHVCQSSIVREAWDRGQALQVHGWIYGIEDGLLRDLEYTVSGSEDVGASYATALAGLATR
ncbi:MAG: carbonate dehydratase [Gammaproteobacteria bacterium]|nr:carbonate dehydratase [Gammaproteobacteria bacterium]